MSGYFLVYFDALWPLISHDPALVEQWSLFFERLDQMAYSQHVYFLTWQSIDKQMNYWLMPHSTPHMHLWCKAFLQRRQGVELRNVSKKWQLYLQDKQNVRYVSVASAKQLTEDQKQSVQAYLEKRWEKIHVVWRVDATIIGGIKCYYDDNILDLSIQSSLQKIASAFDIRG